MFVALEFAKDAGGLRGRWQIYIVPVGLLALGLFLVLDPLVFHGGTFGAEGVQHQFQGALLLGVSGIELARSRGRLQRPLWGALFPLAVTVIGVLFVVHTQHGSGDMALEVVQHRTIGATVIFAGLVKGIDGLELAEGNWARRGWLLLLVAAAIQLFVYVEGGSDDPDSMRPAQHGTSADGSHPEP